MKNITKKRRLAPKQKTPFIVCMLLLVGFLFIPMPASFIVRPLMAKHAPKVAEKISWEGVYIQVARGLLFDSLQIQVNSQMQVVAPSALAKFSWISLASLETRLNALNADTVRVFWKLKSSNVEPDYPVPTESHLAQVYNALNVLEPFLIANDFSIEMQACELYTNSERVAQKKITKESISFVESAPMYLYELTIDIAKQETKQWNVDLEFYDAAIRDWPLPDHFEGSLQFDSLNAKVLELEACWTKGCLQGQGSLAYKGKSKLDLKLKSVPTTPFAHFALPSDATWSGEVSGEISWKGQVAHPQTWNALGSVKIADMLIAEWPFQRSGLVANLASVFKEPIQFKMFQIKDLRLQNGQMRFNGIQYSTELFWGEGRGLWKFPEYLNFNLNGNIAKEAYNKLPGITRLALNKDGQGGASFQVRLEGSFKHQTITPTHNTVGTFFKNLFD